MLHIGQSKVHCATQWTEYSTLCYTVVRVKYTVQHIGQSKVHCATQWTEYSTLCYTVVRVKYTVQHSGQSKVHCATQMLSIVLFWDPFSLH